MQEKMQSKLYISPASSEHIPSLAEIERECFSDGWSENALLSQITSDYALTLVATDENGKVCAYVSGGVTSPECEIFRVATLPEHRRSGIAGRVLREFLSLASARGCSDFFIEVRESNAPARALYASFGFTEVGVRKNYYSQPKENAVLLSLHLDCAPTPKQSN